MGEMFTPEFFKGNRRRLRELFTGTAPIVLTANGTMQRNGEMTYPFRQDSSFWYLTGVDTPDVLLVMDKDKEYLIVPHRDHIIEVFDGAIDAEALMRTSGIDTILSEKDGWKQLGGRLKRVKHVATLPAPPAYVEFHGFYTNPARARLLETLKSHNPNLDILDLKVHLMKQRVIKQPVELAATAAAIATTIATMQAVVSPKRLDRYHYEYEIEAAIDAGFRARGASGTAFSSIIASGPHATVLHHVTNHGPIVPNELTVIDVGAEVSHYAADISRTYPIGTMSKRQERVLEAVLEVQAFGCNQLRPGLSIKEAEKNVEQFMGEKLRELGLIKTIERETVRQFYPHATSHYLGLDAHDVGDYEQPLQPGMVLTVEPGIYIPKEGIGVRIEDDVVVTEDGIRNLSEKLPRDPRG